MICSNNKCGKQWQLIGMKSSDLKKCPFCGTTIRNSFQYPSEAVYFCLNQKDGVEILKMPQLQSMLSDCLGKDEITLELIRNALKSGVGETLYSALKGTPEQQLAAYNRSVGQMIERYSTERSKAEEVVKYFTDALQWKLPTPAKQQETKKTSAVTNQQPVQNQGNAYMTSAQQIQPTAGGNAYMNAPAQQVPNSTAPQQYGNVVMTAHAPVKKKHPILKIFLILILLALAFLIFLFVLGIMADEDDESSPVSKTVASESTAESLDESEISEEDTSKEAESTAVAEVTESASEASSSEESSSEEDISSDESSTEDLKENVYKVKTVSENIVDAQDSDFTQYTSYTIDTDTNKLYYLSGKDKNENEEGSIYCTDLNTGITSLLPFSLPNYNHTPELIYNRFNKTLYTYVYAYDSDKSGLYVDGKQIFNIDVNYASDCYSFCAVEKDKFTSIFEGKAVIIDTKDNQTQEGYLKYPQYYGLYYAEPYLYDECYYWIFYDNYRDSGVDHHRVDITYTLQLSDADKEKSGTIIGEYEGAIGISTYNDEAYIMSTDYSIYKVKTDKLMENIDKTDIEAMEVNADNDTLELVVDSKDIKQTGVNNLNDITSFKVAGDDRFIVFDSFDNVYKMISKE